MSSHIALLRSTERVTDSDAKTIARICASQLWWHVAPAWERTPWTLAYYEHPTEVPTTAFRLWILNRPDEAGALGYHYLDPFGHPYAKAFVDPILQAGGGILDGVAGSLLQTVSHEVCEIFGDPYCNQWVELPDGRETAEELSDAVEGDGYILRLASDGAKGQVSNFLRPNWFQIGSSGPWDWIGTVPGPFQMSRGGYLIVRDPAGRVKNVWGDRVPSWRRELKEHPASRTARRLSSAANPPLAQLAIPERPE